MTYPPVWLAGESRSGRRKIDTPPPATRGKSDASIIEVKASTHDYAQTDTPSGPAGMVLVVEFTLSGARFVGLNGGTEFPFTEAVSFQIDCADQAEVDRYWAPLTEAEPPSLSATPPRGGEIITMEHPLIARAGRGDPPASSSTVRSATVGWNAALAMSVWRSK
ncbi:VOC family protein [Halomonas sp. HK25]|uniref:VOC family protein n=1 Tax=Halomonas sp. HK25 TaxID=3394321 RepID=UPI0039FD5A0A